MKGIHIFGEYYMKFNLDSYTLVSVSVALVDSALAMVECTHSRHFVAG